MERHRFNRTEPDRNSLFLSKLVNIYSFKVIKCKPQFFYTSFPRSFKNPNTGICKQTHFKKGDTNPGYTQQASHSRRSNREVGNAFVLYAGHK